MKSRVFKGLLRTHQWLGSLLALLTLVWFLSGITMVFFGYPSLDERERIDLLKPLRIDVARPCFDAGDSRQHGTEIVQRRHGPLCVYTLDGRRHAHWLESREPYLPLSKEGSVERARTVLSRIRPKLKGEMVPSLEHRGLLQVADQWTLSSRFKPYFPLHRVAFADDTKAVVYLSQRTGELVLITTQRERLLAWLGAIPHWIYPAALRRAREFWRYLVVGLAGMALVMSLSGLVVGGVLQLRRFRRHGRLDAPFSKRLYRWHHYLGLVSGLFTSTWLLSGALSLNPFRWSPGASPSLDQIQAFAGRPKEQAFRPLSHIVQVCQEDGPPHLLRSFYFGGRLHYLCMGPRGTRWVSGQEATSKRYFSENQLRTRFEHAFPRLELKNADWLLESDSYYYPTHYRPDRARLPVLRIELKDRESSLVYLDARRGEIALWHTRASRAERWLYHGLHSLDFALLYERRWLWYLLVLSLLGLGILSSGTGVLLGWRYLRRILRRRLRSEYTNACALAKSRSGRVLKPGRTGASRRP